MFRLLFYHIIDIKSITELLIRFAINFIVIFLIIRFFYYPKYKRTDFIFTYFMFSTIIFLLCYLLVKIEVQIGFALGLFAIFSIIRYRTSSISITELGFLFVTIGISIINALQIVEISLVEIFFANIIILAVLFFLKISKLFDSELSKKITYKNTELINVKNRLLLINELQEKTGIKINRITIDKINFINNTAKITIFFLISENQVLDNETTYNEDDEDDD